MKSEYFIHLLFFSPLTYVTEKTTVDLKAIAGPTEGYVFIAGQNLELVL